jgi:hypothetical protein
MSLLRKITLLTKILKSLRYFISKKKNAHYCTTRFFYRNLLYAQDCTHYLLKHFINMLEFQAKTTIDQNSNRQLKT